ncbi:glycoside hydrolase family 114 protein, partial [Stipitochalara longipes BDJ]
PSATASGQVWKPTAGTTWQIQLSGTVSDLTYPADVFDVDLFDTPQDTINKLKAQGKKVMCYFSAGSYEDWRPDQASFLPSDKGSPLEGWPGEFWLNTSSINVRSIMATRIQMAKDKSCDGVDPDNVDGYDNSNGLSLSPASAADFIKYMAHEAHSRGLSMGLKNAGGIANEVLSFVEWQVNEQCVQYNDCDQLAPFIAQNKPVFHIEYPDGAPNITPDVKPKICNAPSAKGFSTLLKKMSLDDWVDPCA